MTTYDHELTLIKVTYVKDEIGNQKPDETKTTVLCKKQSAGRSEFYNAAAAGYRPEFVFVIHGFEYSGETMVEFEGQRYNVVRTYQTEFEEIELTVERVSGRG